MSKTTEKQPRKLRNGNLSAPGFKKGQSGNPNGRPKGVKNFKTAIEELFSLPIDTLEEDIRLRIIGLNPKIKNLEEALNARMLLDALNGDSYSKKEILERLHGKTKEQVELAGEVVHDITVRFLD